MTSLTEGELWGQTHIVMLIFATLGSLNMFPFGKDWKKPWRAGGPVALDQFIGVLRCIPGPSLVSGGSYHLFSCQDVA